MVRAKNYETMSTFVKVMQKKLWPLFFRTRCTVHVHTNNEIGLHIVGLPYADSEIHPDVGQKDKKNFFTYCSLLNLVRRILTSYQIHL